MGWRFEVYRDAAGAFRFRLVDDRGATVLVSEGYRSKSTARSAVESVRTIARGLADPTESGLQEREASLAIALHHAVERAVGGIDRYLTELEHLRQANRELRQKLAEAEAEIEQLELIRNALTAELHKPRAHRRSAKPLAAAAGFLVGVITTAAGGAVEGLTSAAVEDPPTVVVEAAEPADQVTNLALQVQLACEEVQALARPDEGN